MAQKPKSRRKCRLMTKTLTRWTTSSMKPVSLPSCYRKPHRSSETKPSCYHFWSDTVSPDREGVTSARSTRTHDSKEHDTLLSKIVSEYQCTPTRRPDLSYHYLLLAFPPYRSIRLGVFGLSAIGPVYWALGSWPSLVFWKRNVMCTSSSTSRWKLSLYRFGFALALTCVCSYCCSSIECL